MIFFFISVDSSIEIRQNLQTQKNPIPTEYKHIDIRQSCSHGDRPVFDSVSKKIIDKKSVHFNVVYNVCCDASLSTYRLVDDITLR